jgi:hypothetical protein
MDWFTKLGRGALGPSIFSFFFHLRRSVSAQVMHKKTNW